MTPLEVTGDPYRRIAESPRGASAAAVVRPTVLTWVRLRQSRPDPPDTDTLFSANRSACCFAPPKGWSALLTEPLHKEASTIVGSFLE
ncbi:hypothetical protein LSAT2_007693 [Lamellibrachia satsuma]|nr:hypothetical protein LSAT2_007693 [Lamellibrachia satsuma]